MMIMAKKNTKKTINRYHLTAIIDRNITYNDKKSGKINIYTEKEHSIYSGSLSSSTSSYP